MVRSYHITIVFDPKYLWMEIRFADRVQPWVHYVPVQVDYSDLYDTLAFFRGGLYGEGARVDLARKIAEAGRRWSKTFWRKEDMTAYLYRCAWHRFLVPA